MIAYERSKKIAAKRGLSLQDVAVKAHMGINSIYRWKNSTPSSDKVKAVADVLNVSVDYLLGNTDDPNPPESANEPTLSKNQKLIAYSIDPDVSDEERNAIIEMVQQAMKLRKRL